MTESRQILRRGDQAKIPDAAFDEGSQRVVDHGLVVNRLELFARDQRQRKQPGTSASGQNNAFHFGPHDRKTESARKVNCARNSPASFIADSARRSTAANARNRGG